MKSIQRNQGGFSLVEILLVLGIIAILAIAAFIIFPQVQASNRANTELSNITTVTAGTKNLFGSTRNYAPATNTILNQARVFPSSMNANVFTGGTITSSWGGAVSVTGSTAVGVADAVGPTTFFRIVYSAVPSEICSKLVPGLVTNFQAVYVDVGNTPTVTATTPAAIVTACSAGSVVNVVLVST